VFAHVKSESEMFTEHLLEGREHFSQNIKVSVAVSKLGKLALDFCSLELK